MPPASQEYLGPKAIATFLHASARWRAGRQIRLVPTLANTQPAFGCYLMSSDGPFASSSGLLVLTVFDGQISAITRFLDEDLPRLFGLADPSSPANRRHR